MEGGGGRRAGSSIRLSMLDMLRLLAGPTGSTEGQNIRLVVVELVVIVVMVVVTEVVEEEEEEGMEKARVAPGPPECREQKL